ncbi:M48 family metallopeptidase [Coriobacterium glomerans]|uniref:M48 family metallopeptidase n=1 Tax=Coriobacterium glomerans TaxID=33871 RepID=UPI0002DB65E3|nr:YgjP-like metallopeptidase domain-containing protein [Coriobacterium glomerans]
MKNLNLRIRSDATAVMSIPVAASRDAAQRFIDRRVIWILKHVDRLERISAARRCAHADGAGELIALWGEPVKAKEVLRAASVGPRRTRLDALYHDELVRALPLVAARIETVVGVRARTWRVRDMTSRWGSCTPATGAIRISSALAAFPPACLDCVVTHELIHLIEPSHKARFHKLLDRHFPRNRIVRSWLKRSPMEIARARSAGALDLD